METLMIIHKFLKNLVQEIKYVSFAPNMESFGNVLISTMLITDAQNVVMNRQD